MNIFQRLAQQNDQKDFNTVKFEDGFESEAGVGIEEEDTSNIFERMAKKNEEEKANQFGFLDTLRDIGEQVATKGISGVVGAYGNILDAVGLQMKEGEQLPGKKEKQEAEGELLDKANKGEKLSFAEWMSLAEDDDIAPNITRLPTSKEVQKGIENVSGIGEGKTSSGRIAGRGAEFLGEGVATGAGGKALAFLGGAGVTGQGIREVGLPEWAATTAETAIPFGSSLISKKLPGTKNTKDTIEAGRKIGLTEDLITPLIQGETKVSTLGKVAKKGSRTKKKFAQIKEKLGDSYDNIKSSQAAKTKIPNAEQINLRREFGAIRNDLSKTLAPSPDKQAAIDYVEKALDTLRNIEVTPEHLVNFWQDINKSVNWNSLNGGKKALARLKEPVSKTLKNVAPQLAEDFEMTNQLYTKYAQISRQLKPNIVDSIVNKGEIMAGIPAAGALVFGNPWPLIGVGGEVGVRLLAREMLINPYFQQLGTKLMTNFNSGSVKGIEGIMKQAREYMERKHPNENWQFLTEKEED